MSRQSFTPERISKAHNYAEYELCRWCVFLGISRKYSNSYFKNEIIPTDALHFIRQGQLNFLLYGQSGELYRVGRSVGRQNNNNNNNPKFQGRHI